MADLPLAALATVGDLEDGWRPLRDADEKRVAETLLRRASALLRARVPRLDGRIEAGELDRDVVVGGVTDMVAAVLAQRAANPDMASSVSSQTGPFTEALRWDSPAGALQVPRWLLTALTPVSTGSSAPGSIVTAPGVWGRRL